MFSADLGVTPTASAPTNDPNFKQVALLLHGDGTNGAQNNTFIDSSANNFTITRTGNVAQGTFSPFSLADGQWSNYFDGNGDNLNVPNNAAFSFGSDNFTIEAWVNPNAYTTGLDTQGTIVCQFSNQPSNRSWILGIYSNQYFFSGSATGDYTSAVTLSGTSGATIGVWKHVAVVRNGSTFTLYVNGVAESTATFAGSLFNSTRVVEIGEYSGSRGPMNGYISNLRIVKGSAVYTTNFTPPTSALTAISGTSLLTCQSNRFKDNSSNNFTITSAGDTKVTAFSPFAPSAAYDASVNGGSAYFDGSGDFLRLPSSTAWDFGTGDFTIEFWVYPIQSATSANETYYPFVGTDGSYTSGYTYNWVFLYVNQGGANKLAFNRKTTTSGGANNVSIQSNSFTLNYNTWIHIAAVRQSGTIYFYVNGIATGSGAYPNDISITQGLVINAVFGGGSFQSVTWTPMGYTSNLRIVKGTAVYTANFTPPTAPLSAITNTSLLLNFTNAGIIDNAGKNDIETVGNAQVSTSVKKYGTGSMYFDGTGDYLKFLNTSETQFGTGDFTIEFWLYFVARGTNGSCLIGNYNSYTTGALAIFAGHGTGNTAKYQVSYNGASFPTIQSTTSISYNTWQHIALVRNAGTMTFYVDGVSNGSISATASINGVSNLWYVGAAGDALSSYYLNGYIDDLRITKGQALYTSNFTPPTQAFSNI